MYASKSPLCFCYREGHLLIKAWYVTTGLLNPAVDCLLLSCSWVLAVLLQQCVLLWTQMLMARLAQVSFLQN